LIFGIKTKTKPKKNKQTNKQLNKEKERKEEKNQLEVKPNNHLSFSHTNFHAW